MAKKNPVVHFEMPYENSERVSSFYTQAFGWEMFNTGEQMGHYLLAGTAETDENRMVKTPGTINGGFFPKQPDSDNLHPSFVISVDDIHDAMNKIKAAGGTVHGEPVEITGIGLYVSFTDTEGNRASVMQAMRG